MKKINTLDVFTVLKIPFQLLILIVKFIYSIGETIWEGIWLSRLQSVEGKIVLITGTGHGIGKQLALSYALDGAIVVGIDVNSKTNEETIEKIINNGGRAFSYTCDVSSREEIMETVKVIQQKVGDISILINNAGIMPTKAILNHTTEEIEAVFKINVMAHFWLLQAILPSMKKKNEGHIVALSSCAGLIGFEYLVPYCATKFAVRGMMEALNEELRFEKCNVRTTSIYPYITDTGLCKNIQIKFNKLMAPLDPKLVADEIMYAQRKNILELSIPGYLFYLNNWTRTLPSRVGTYLKDAFGCRLLPE